MILPIFQRDLKLARAAIGQTAMTPVFFILATTLFPLALGSDTALLAKVAPGLLVIAALFAALLPLETLFTADKQDGTLDALQAGGAPFALYVTGKLAAHWLLSSLPVLIAAPVLALMLGIGAQAGTVIISLLPATMLFCLIGALGAALTLGTKQGSILLALLIIPLYIPVMIYSAGAIDLARNGLNTFAPLGFLWAMLAFALPSVPLVAGAILKFQVRT